MKRGLSISGETAGLIASIFLIVSIGFVLACAQSNVRPAAPQPPKYIPSSQWGNNFTYKYNPPAEMTPASVDAVVIVVNPSYREEESALMNRTYSKVGKGFSTSMGVDMDKVIIGKGMTSKGPFPSLDEITYSDKKMSDLTFVPKVFVTTEIKYLGAPRVEHNYLHEGITISVITKDFEMIVGGWVSFVMQEPLSGQKMWIKRLELEEATVYGKEYHKATPKYETRSYQTTPVLFMPSTTEYYKALSGYDTVELLYDGKVDALADAIKDMYPVIMKKCWTYIDTEEIISLKEKVKEIRGLKRY